VGVAEDVESFDLVDGRFAVFLGVYSLLSRVFSLVVLSVVLFGLLDDGHCVFGFDLGAVPSE